MRRAISPDFGFEAMVPQTARPASKLEAIGMGEVKRKFAPEFVNRIDAVITYRPLAAETVQTELVPLAASPLAVSPGDDFACTVLPVADVFQIIRIPLAGNGLPIAGFNLLLIILAVILDVGSHSGGGVYYRRRRV